MKNFLISLVLILFFSTVSANESLQQLAKKSVNKIANDVGLATLWFDKKSFRDSVTGDILKVSSYLHNELEVSFSANKFELKDDLDEAEFLISVSFQKQGDNLVVFIKYRSIDEMNFKTIKEVVAINKLPKDSLESTDKIITKSDREKILNSLKNTEKQNEKISKGIEKIGEGMDTLKKNGGLIVDPKTPKEFYNNAKIYEIQGEQKNAMKMYEKYFRKSKEYVDPYESYISILKDREGKTGAREEIEEMLDEEPENLSVQYAFALLQTKKKKRKLLNKIVKDNPNYAPALYQLALLSSKKTLGAQSLSEKKAEKGYIDRFLDLNSKGKLLKWFIDKEIMRERVKYANERKVVLDRIAKDAFKNPINVERMYSANAWLLNLSIADKTTEIYYRRNGMGEFKSTGFFDYVDQETGNKMPRNQVQIGHTSGKVKYLEFKYKDQLGQMNGPFKYDWVTKAKDGKKSISPKAESDIKILKISEGSWVVKHSSYIYFTHLASYKEGIDKIEYGINKDNTDITITELTRSNTFIQGKDVKKITLKVFFADGTTSQLKEYNF